MELRNLGENELLQCTKTFVNVFNAAPWHDEWSFAQAQKYLTDFYYTPGFIGVLAIENEEIIGFIFGVQKAWWSGNEFYIHEMCVDTKQQNKGVGTALLQYLIQTLGQDISNITLLTDRGIPAEAFYKKNGFQEIERLVFLSKDL